MSDRVVGNTLDGVVVAEREKTNERQRHVLQNGDANGGNDMDTYVYFKIPSSLDVHIMMLLSAEPEANLLPARKGG